MSSVPIFEEAAHYELRYGHWNRATRGLFSSSYPFDQSCVYMIQSWKQLSVLIVCRRWIFWHITRWVVNSSISLGLEGEADQLLLHKVTKYYIVTNTPFSCSVQFKFVCLYGHFYVEHQSCYLLNIFCHLFLETNQSLNMVVNIYMNYLWDSLLVIISSVSLHLFMVVIHWQTYHFMLSLTNSWKINQEGAA